MGIWDNLSDGVDYSLESGNLRTGGIYLVHSRNLVAGAYRPSTKGFIGIRTKFDSRYLFEEYHKGSGAPHGTVWPIAYMGQVPDGVLVREHMYPSSEEKFPLNKELFDVLELYNEEAKAMWETERGITT